MTPAPDVHVYPDADGVAAAAADQLLARIVELQAAGTTPRIGLTGGGVGIGILEKIRRSPRRDDVDWGNVEFYWGDERFLPPGDPERNETQARQALLDHIPVDPAKVFPMGADEGSGPEGATEAAAAYAAVLSTAAGPEAEVPALDVLLLGMGGEGHTASIFPRSPAVHAITETVVPVYDCPKPPPTRVSLTLPAIQQAAEVWITTAGAAKAAAVALAMKGADDVSLPVAGATGRDATRWLIDEAAASRLPADTIRSEN